jgi:hypothetical protein
MTEIRVMTEMDLEAVVGGAFVSVPISIENSVQNNIPVQVAAATSLGGNATAGNGIGGLTNLGFQGILGF